MPSSTPLGISYPVKSDIHPSQSWWTSLAETTDQAIQARVATAESSAISGTKALDRSLREWVSQQISAAGLAGATGPEIDAAVARVLESQEWKDRQGRSVLVEDYGAVGDGSTDDTAAIQAALSNQAKAPVEFQARTYKVSATLNVPSGVRVYGNGATIVAGARLSALFRMAGSAHGVDVPTVGSMDAGEVTITTATAHGLAVGEVFRLVGQRQIASIDAPSEDRLGMATGDKNGPWNGEYAEVRQVLSSTKVVVAAGLIFNGYRADKSQETHAQARDRTTLNKMTWHRGGVIADFTLRGDFLDTIRMDFCRDAVVADIRDERTGTSGAFAQFTGSLRCLITGCTTGYPNARPDDVQYYQRNLIMNVSSQACVVDSCRVTGGGQIVDASYLQSYKIPCIAPVVRHCDFSGYDDNAVTTHPGVWGAIVEDNDFRAGNTGGEVASGIGIRSPYSVITGNRISGVPRTKATTGTASDGNYGNYGVQLYDAGGHHCEVTGNQLTGFDIGVGILDGNEAPERHGTVSTLIAGNKVTDCQHGIRTRKSGIFSGWTDITIQANHVVSKLANAVGINLDPTGSGKPWGTAVLGNKLHLTGADPTPIWLGSARDPILIGNAVTGGPTVLHRSPAGVNNGTIALAANVVASASGVTLYPPPGTGTGGSVSVRADPAVAGAILIGD